MSDITTDSSTQPTEPLQENGYVLVSALFLKLLALIYFIAFASLSGQIVGLAGADGIQPLHILFENATHAYGAQRFLIYPTLFWLDASDTALKAATWLGCAFSVTLFINFRPRLSLVLLFALYLSLFHAGQIFMNFQWDYLLMEAGFLAIFLRPDSRIMVFLFRWLLFRLRFLSGLSKIVSGDPAWTGLTALTFYFETQPLPHIGAWYAHHLPVWLLMVGAAATLFIELVVPFLMFTTRRLRFIAAWLTIGLQLLILLTSNHNWFNLLSLTLCLFLFDDRALSRVLPRGLVGLLLGQQQTGVMNPVYKSATTLLAAGVLIISGSQIWEMASGTHIGGEAGHIRSYIEQWNIVNKYHVFPTIEQRRVELIIEGTRDGIHWKPYRFRYKPGALDKPLKFIVPHHPRLDWMMWFVPLNPIFLPWFEDFLYALLDNAPTVTAMLEQNPFPDAPPKAIRVQAYLYQFTTPEEHEATGNWWKREYLGPFAPLPFVSNEPATAYRDQ